MFYKILSLEIKKNLKSPAFYIFFLIFLTVSIIFTMTTDPYTQFLGIAHGKEWHNAPIIIAQILTRLGIFGLLFTMIIVGRSVAKDFEVNIHELIFTRPISKFQYLGGRFFGSLIANLIIFMGIILGFEIGIAFMEPQYSGPFQPGEYLLPILVMVIPNLLLMGGIMFSLATITRNMIATYLAGIAFLAVYAIIGVMLHRMDNETLQVLLDPFGLTALTVYSKFWTVAEMNSHLMPINTTFLINRIIWLTVSIGTLWFTFRKFNFVAFLEKKKKRIPIVSDKTELIEYDLKAPVIATKSNKLFSFSQCVTISWRNFKRIAMHPAFLILTALALTEIVANFRGGLGNQSGHIYPFTSWYLKQTMHIWIYMLPMTIFFGGMLIWKEKDNRTDEIFNTLPVPNWFSYANKLLTLIGIYILYLGLTIIAGIVTQVFILDFTDIEPGLYFKQLFGVEFFIFLHMAIVVLFIQNLSPNKYVGFFWCALFFMGDLIALGAFKFDNYLLRYGRVPDFIYSNLNGFGHFGQTILWYTIYWLFLGAVIAWLTILLWRRTNENSIRIRLKYLRSNISRNQIAGIAVLLFMFVITGLFIGYNKYVLNPYYSEYDERKMSADYEKKFSKYMHLPQPTITDIKLNVDLFPQERTVNIKGEYVLFNRHDQSIKELYISLNDWNLCNLDPIEFNRSFTKMLHADEFGFRVFELDEPLQAGDTMTMSFKYDIIAKGFTDNQPKNDIAENGTCLILSSFISQYFPIIGYNINAELIRDRFREEFNLPHKADAPKISEADKSLAIFDVSRPNYEAVISTSNDQTVISGGKLIDQWQEGKRNYFHYKTDTIIENEIAILSGRYDVSREQYKGVNVEVYYHPKHNYNIRSILDGLKDSYDYGNKYFSEYPYGDLRIVEIPNYMTHGAARHFPTTFIWIESEGFITRYEEGDIDIVYGIAAHENAHHWWGGIVTPAFAEGAFMLTETMAQYVMATLTEKKFGKNTGRDYRKREMESYLRRRKHDTEGEKPLLESSVRQSYIGYKKSTVVMCALQDYIGEDSLGKALGRIVDMYGYRLDTFALASDLIDEFYKVTPDSLKYLVNDMFLKITLYENKINGARYEKTEDGHYLVELDVETIKYYADSVGNQAEAPLKDYIYVALMDEAGEAFYYKKHLFTSTNSSVQILTEQKPVQAGIDPFYLLIDRELEDNICDVKEVGDPHIKLNMEGMVKSIAMNR
jgi:ABC-type transport system involved in multi-copper enzyme maturation permease subunit